MKKILLAVSVLTAAIGFLSSCQKEIRDKIMVKEIRIDTTITAGNDYLLDLSSYGREGDYATIVEKGSNASISQLENETDMFTTVYHYKPNAKFSGTDLVTLSIHDNSSCRKDSTTLYLNLTVK